MAQLRPKTLRGRLVLLGALAVIPVTLGILYAGMEQRRAAAAGVEREALTLARATASEQDRLVIETRQLLTVLARVPRVRSGTPEECSAFLAQVLREGHLYGNLGRADPSGLVRCSAIPISAPVDVSHRPWFRRAVATGGFSVGDFQVGLITRVPGVNFGFPIYEEGELLGVVYAVLPLTWLQERIASAALPPASEVLVLDGTGTVLAHFPETAGEVGRSLAGTALVDTILAHPRDAVMALRGADGVRRLYATTPLQDLPRESPVVVAVGIPERVAYAPVNRAILRNFGLLALVLGAMVALTWWSSGRLVLRPIRNLLVATRRLGEDMSTRVTLSGAPSEIEELAGSFNEMAATLQQHVGEIRANLEHIERLSRIRAVLTGINAAILRIRDRDELLRAACRISVKEGEFALAWVAEHDAEGGGIRAVAAARGLGLDGEAPVPAALCAPGGMVAKALEGGEEVVSNDLSAEDWGDGGGDELRAMGFRSAASLPLRVGARVVAALNLYTREADFFTEDEIRLMRSLAADTSLGLEFLEQQERLHYLVNFDPLTDLPNRSLFADRVEQAIARSRQERRLTAVLMIGIDRLSDINATLGHQAGDQVLRSVGRHLREALRETDTAARLGSKDFGVVLASLSTPRRIETAADALMRALPHSLTYGREQIFLSYRMGIAVYPADGEEADVLIKSATLALEAAQAPAAHPIAFYSKRLNEEAQERRKLGQELRTALARSELTLQYQPVVALDTGDPIGMEALIRWRSSELGEVSPATFIPLAEEMGLIREIGEWVIGTAARQGRLLHEEGFHELRMNVNVSVSQFSDPVFVANFTRTIEESGIDLSRLGIGIEITESELMENIQGALGALKRFQQAHMWIYIDDFGTGYSSLNYLRVLPIDALKIDRSFISDLSVSDGEGDAVAVVKSIVALGHSLDLQVIAEGVERAEQLAILQDLGCDAGQGFLFSRPLSPEQLTDYLRSRVLQ